ncbi:hypothetical protein DIURU_000754 [Diutina rugosa]|uniref:Sphingoid long-chain base transporter RSB1 n=1 Tax=Diutina rugosa TaxID=5481 RepID=A0A642UWG7_DIURU|nr:uncharacterized protein DIURU_000754 [Diutina rugosa]KAA8907070.1 hypothetical protein DIURU_000754 [Diutina rugosa]
MDVSQLISSRLASTWAPSVVPTTTSLSYIAPTKVAALTSTLSALSSSLGKADKAADAIFIIKSMRAAEASLTVARGQQVLATATAPSVVAQASSAVFNATLNLVDLETIDNFYGTRLSLGGNAVFTALFGLLCLWYLIVTVWSRHVYFGVCMFCGTGLEFAGYLTRTLAANGEQNTLSYFLCQFICITIAPAFIMAGIYFLLAQLVAIYGRKYSLLPPMGYSYIFIVCDVISLVVQAAGGGLAGTAFSRGDDADPGTYTMVGGIAFQVLSMSLFLILLFQFLWSVWRVGSGFGMGTFGRMLFNTRSAQARKREQDPYYTPEYASVRHRQFFGVFPLIIVISVGFVYVRCIYRVVELAEGWRGYLITHEPYLLVLESSMIFCATVLYTVFHPALVMGRGVDLSSKAIRGKRSAKQTEPVPEELPVAAREESLTDTTEVVPVQYPEKY